jgi:PatG Domain
MQANDAYESAPQAAQQQCSTCGGAVSDAAFIYALGQIEPRFPRVGIEKEFAQTLGRSDAKGQTDRQAFHSALARRENRYLARQLCWVFTVQGLESYLLEPRDPLDLDLLIQAAEPKPNPWIHAVIGTRGPIAPPDQCNGLMVPVVLFDQIYSFDRASLIAAIPRPEKMTADAFGPAAEELLDRILLSTDNAGATDEHRALNYLAMRYPAIYAKAASAFADNFSLTGVETFPLAISPVRRVIEVAFAFTNRTTDFTDWASVRVDVTDEFPFLVSKLSPYYPR